MVWDEVDLFARLWTVPASERIAEPSNGSGM